MSAKSYAIAMLDRATIGHASDYGWEQLKKAAHALGVDLRGRTWEELVTLILVGVGLGCPSIPRGIEGIEYDPTMELPGLVWNNSRDGGGGWWQRANYTIAIHKAGPGVRKMHAYEQGNTPAVRTMHGCARPGDLCQHDNPLRARRVVRSRCESRSWRMCTCQP